MVAEQLSGRNLDNGTRLICARIAFFADHILRVSTIQFEYVEFINIHSSGFDTMWPSDQIGKYHILLGLIFCLFRLTNKFEQQAMS